MEEPLIPGLPDDVARECLHRVPYTGFHTAAAACKLWRAEVHSPSFHRLRKSAGLTRSLLAMAQSSSTAVSTTTTTSTKEDAATSASSYRISLLEPSSGQWATLPPIPFLPHGLPLFCHLAGLGRHLAVVGGWDPATWAASDEVFLYDFVAAAWRRGEPMPGPRRSFFACASDGDRWVFVAGGHDEEKNALKSAAAYDLAADQWVPIPDMECERDECKGVYSGGRFQVLGGYSTEFQGQFGKSAESFDVAAWAWGGVKAEALQVGSCPRTVVAAAATAAVTGEGRLYRCRAGKVEVREKGARGWRAVAEVPEGARVAPWVAALGGREEEEDGILVIGASCHGGAHEGYVFEVGSGRWRGVAVPEEYSGHVQAGCCLDL